MNADDSPRSVDLTALCVALNEHAPLPIASAEGPHHIVRYANPAFCRLIKREKVDILGKSFAEIMPETGKYLPLLDQVYRTGRPVAEVDEVHAAPAFWSYALWPVMDQGLPIGVIINVNNTEKLRDETVAMNEELMLGSIRQHELTEAAEALSERLKVQIEERERVEEDLRQAHLRLGDRAVHLEELVKMRTAELSATNKQLEAFIYSIAHDLRAPLRTMQGYAAILAEEAAAVLSPTCVSYTQTINKSAQFMDALLIDLLDFSRISQQDVELAVTDLEETVDVVLLRLQIEIQEKGARVESTGPWPKVMAHSPTLAQVLYNLTSNGLKFARSGSPVVIQIRTEERDENIRIWVEDNGVGISPQHQKEIFRLFTRLEGEKYPGTGVGLAIVLKALERMGGQVGVESKEGVGSHFWFELKRASPAFA